MRRWIVAAFAILAVNLTVEAQTPATFIQDVQPILVKHCQSCHRRGEVAPMPLTTYAETKPRAGKIKDLVSGKKMPPVIGTPHYAVLTRGEGLTQAEINTLVRWADTGAREGAPAHNKNTPTPSKR